MAIIQLRRAQLTDAHPLSELIYENAQTLLRPHYSPQQWAIFIRYYSPPVVAQKIATQVVFCAHREGELVGTIALDGDFVVGFYTRLQHINQGIGGQLMAHLEEYARSNGVRRLQLAASPEGLLFYHKHGWQTERNFTIDHYGVGFEETLMSKSIS